METKSHTEVVVSYIKDDLDGVPWIHGIFECDSDAYDVYIDTNTGFLSVDQHLHTIENVGIEVVSFSTEGAAGMRIYGNLR